MIRHLTLILLLLNLISCANTNVNPDKLGSNENQAEALKPEAEPVNPEPADPLQQHCQFILDSINTGDTKEIAKLFDVNILARNTSVTMNIPAEYRNEFTKGLKAGLANYIKTTSQNLSSFAYWYDIEHEDSKRCIIHSDFSETRGLSILEFKLGQYRNKVVISDILDFSTKSWVSNLLRENLTALFSFDTSGPDTRKVTNMAQLRLAVNQRDIERAWQHYQYLSSDKVISKNALFVMAESASDEKDLELILIELSKLIEEDDRGLIFFDYYVMHQEYDKALALVNQFEKSTNEDAVFSLLRAGVYREQKNIPQFASEMNSAIDRGMGLEDIYWMSLIFFCDRAEFKDAILVLEILQETFGYSFTSDAFNGIPEYKGLIASSEFKTWARKL